MTVTAAPTALARPRLDVGLAFKKGWDAFTADIVPFLVGTLIAGLLSVITLGILAGPLVAGLYSMAIRRIRDGRRAEIGDVFSCFDRFWSYLWAALVLVVLVGLASLTIVGGVLLATIWIYVFPFMVDRRMGLTDAMAASYHRVVDNGFWEHLALFVIFVAIGAVANGWVGMITFPFTVAVLAGAYFATRDYDHQTVQLSAPPAPPAAPAQTAAPVTPEAPVTPAETAAGTTAPASEAAAAEPAAAPAEPTQATETAAGEAPEAAQDEQAPPEAAGSGENSGTAEA
ncbi:MAG: hypothetical protein GX624_00935 [Actinobacteria bacterium]|nr:hypothetical protein [Actinomycetota bacterium]